MVVTYAKLWPRFATELDVSDATAKLLGAARVLICDPVLERGGTASLAQRIRTIDSAVRECDLLILRGLQKEDFTQMPDEIGLLQRLTGAGRSCLLLGGPPNPQIVPYFGMKAKDVPTSWLAALRQLEIQALIERTGAHFRDSGLHYLLPSGEHASTFLRFADALQDPTEVSRLADWVAAHVTEECILVGDNGSLLPLLLAVKDRVRSFRKFECHIRTISAYPAGAEDIEPVLDDVATRYPALPLLFLVSVSSSGKLVKRLLALAPASARVLVMCNANAADTSNATLYRCEMDHASPGVDGKCAQCPEKHLVGIDPRTYERIPTITYEPRAINVALAERHAPFWAAVERTNAVKLHYNLPVSESEVRHHGVYLDVAALLGDRWFRSLMIDKLRTLLPPGLLLLPDHPAAAAVLDVVWEVFPKTAAIKVGKGPFPAAAVQRLRKLPDASVLVVDDALVQGTTIRGLRYAIYQATQSMKSPPSVSAFVCIARPDNESTFRNSANPYRNSAGLQFHYGYRINLPTSGEDHCPWCKERKLLSQLAPRLTPSVRGTAVARRDVLDAGELASKFLWDTAGLDGSEVTKDSFFGELGPRTAFAAATGAAQEMRLELAAFKKAGAIAVMNLPMALSNYFDTVLLAGMLRTLDPREFYYLGQDHDVRTAVARFPAIRAYPGLTAELGWAAINRKMPPDLVVTKMSEVPKTPDIALLTAILEWQHATSS